MTNKYLKWYLKWGKNYFRYMFFQFIRVTVLLLVIIVLKDLFGLIKGKKHLINIFNYRLLYFIVVLSPFLLFPFHLRWKSMILKYRLSDLSQEMTNELINAYKKTIRRYSKWKSDTAKLILLNAFIAPLTFIIWTNLAIYIKYHQVNIKTYLSQFDPGLFPFIMIIFYLFGIWGTRKYWLEYLRPDFKEIIALNNRRNL